MVYYDRAMRPLWWYDTDAYLQPQQPPPAPMRPPSRTTTSRPPQMPTISLSGQPLTTPQMSSALITQGTQPARSIGSSYGRPMPPRRQQLPKRSMSGQPTRFASGGVVGGEKMPTKSKKAPGDYLLQPIIVGDGGEPELLLAPAGSQVIPMSQVQSMATGGTVVPKLNYVPQPAAYNTQPVPAYQPSPAMPWYKDEEKLGQLGTALSTIGSIWSQGNPIATDINARAYQQSQDMLARASLGGGGGSPAPPTAGPVQAPTSALAGTNIQSTPPPPATGSPWDFPAGAAGRSAVAPRWIPGLDMQNYANVSQIAANRSAAELEERKQVLAEKRTPAEVRLLEAQAQNYEEAPERMEREAVLQLKYLAEQERYMEARQKAGNAADLKKLEVEHGYRMQQIIKDAGLREPSAIHVGGGVMYQGGKYTTPPADAQAYLGRTEMSTDRVRLLLETKIGPQIDLAIANEEAKQSPNERTIADLMALKGTPVTHATWSAVYSRLTPEQQVVIDRELLASGIDPSMLPYSLSGSAARQKAVEDSQVAATAKAQYDALPKNQQDKVKLDHYAKQVRFRPDGAVEHNGRTVSFYTLVKNVAAQAGVREEDVFLYFSALQRAAETTPPATPSLVPARPVIRQPSAYDQSEAQTLRRP